MSIYILIPVFIFIVLIIFLPIYLENFIFQNKENELLSKAEIISSTVKMDGPLRTGMRLGVFEKILDTGIIIINQEGNIVNRGEKMKGMMHHGRHFSSYRRDRTQNIFLIDKEKIKSVFQGKQVTFRGESPLINESVIAVGVPLNTSPQLALFLISPLEGLQQLVNKIRNLTLQVILIAIGLALLLAYFITKNIVQPVRQIKNKACQIADGELNVRLNNLPGDEIGTLGDSFNYMAEKLQKTVSDLHTEKNRMQNMLNSMTEGVLGVSRNKKIILANPTLKSVFDIKTDVNGYQLKKYFPAEIIEIVEKVLQGKGEVEIEFEWCDKIIVAQAAPVFKNEQTLWGSIILVRDVTRIRKLAEMRQLFVANVSHELKTPLTAVRGYIEAILDGVVEDATEQRRYLNKVLKETKRLSRLTGEVLDLSRLQSDQIEFKITEVDLIKLIKSVLGNFKHRFGQKVVKFDSAGEVYVRGDRDRISQVLVNLLDNAVNFTDKEGEIKVTVEKKYDFARVQVIDDGRGIPQAELPYIWERFHQADRSRNPAKEGTGLGLAIVKKIVEGLDGKVNVESKLNEGSRFSFMLPLVKEK